MDHSFTCGISTEKQVIRVLNPYYFQLHINISLTKCKENIANVLIYTY